MIGQSLSAAYPGCFPVDKNHAPAFAQKQLLSKEIPPPPLRGETDLPQKRKGLLLVYTGNGKGKTTAALGLTLRALGHGWRVCFIQFIKGGWQSGELTALSRFSDLLDFHVAGRGFTWKSKDLDEDAAAARVGWELARKTLAEGQHRLMVLDE
ncbi:cob(I)yrinic acid a,c-diamide adenosyltransferase, partial [Desulfobulbus sp. F4]|nr:cob(I)yrinic acid a,c-diamide adenosyltransferase [Desulfobulbus sp. F4]